MTTVITGEVGGEAVDVTAPEGAWVTSEHGRSEAVVREVAGLAPGDLQITMGGERLDGLSAGARHRARLCVARCRLDPLPALRVADVVGLGLRAPQPPLWQSLAGTAGARAASDDDEAQVRALAGRMGLAGWVDRTAVNLPLRVEALVDVARALAGAPRALVWRRPEWLDPASLADLHAAVTTEQRLAGFTVIELVQRPAASLGAP